MNDKAFIKPAETTLFAKFPFAVVDMTHSAVLDPPYHEQRKMCPYRIITVMQIIGWVSLGCQK